MKKTTKLLSAIMAIVMLATTFSGLLINSAALNLNEVESNNTAATANMVDPGDTITAAITEGDTDFFKVIFSRPARLSVEANFYGTSLNLQILDSEGKELSSKSANISGSYGFLKDSVDLVAGTYYIVFGNNSPAGGYTFTVSSTVSDENYLDLLGRAIRYYEPNDLPVDATEIPYRTTVNGQFAVNDNIDIFKVALHTSGDLKIDFRSVLDGTLIIMDVNRNIIRTTKLETGVYTLALATGTYYIQLEVVAGNTGTYKFDLSLETARVSGGSANNSAAAAHTVLLSERVFGQVGICEDEDYFKLPVTKSQVSSLFFETTAPLSTITIHKNSATGTSVFNRTITSSGSGYVGAITLDAGAIYYIVVSGYDVESDKTFAGDYAFCLKAELDPAVPTFKPQSGYNMYSGQTRNLAAITSVPAGYNIAWTSDNDTIAMVSDTGVVTAVNPGTTNVRGKICAYKPGVPVAGTNENKYATIEVIIPVTVSFGAIELDRSAVFLKSGKSTNVTVTKLLPSTSTITWESADPSIATVQGRYNGTNFYAVITAGNFSEYKQTTVKAKFTLGLVTYVASCVVSVNSSVDVTKITLNKIETTIKKGKTEKLTATVTPIEAENKSIVWSSNDNSIATVSQDGTVKGVKGGTVLITATSVSNPKVSASCKVTISATNWDKVFQDIFGTIWTLLKKLGEGIIWLIKELWPK